MAWAQFGGPINGGMVPGTDIYGKKPGTITDTSASGNQEITDYLRAQGRLPGGLSSGGAGGGGAEIPPASMPSVPSLSPEASAPSAAHIAGGGSTSPALLGLSAATPSSPAMPDAQAAGQLPPESPIISPGGLRQSLGTRMPPSLQQLLRVRTY